MMFVSPRCWPLLATVTLDPFVEPSILTHSLSLIVSDMPVKSIVGLRCYVTRGSPFRPEAVRISEMWKDNCSTE